MRATSVEPSAYADINMTPLIDVMLVLLIIFIITIPLQTHAVKLDNPRPGTTDPTPQPAPVELFTDFDGSLSWNGMRVDRAALRADIQQEAHRPVQPEVHLTVDRSSRYEVVAQTLADLQRLGLRKIGVVNRSQP